MYTNRNEEIYQMRLAGSTFREIAKVYGISVERIRQICLKCQNTNQKEVESELYQLIVNENSRTFTLGLYNTLRRFGIDNIEDLQNRIDDINQHPESYVYIGDRSRSYLNEKLRELV